MPRAFSKEKVEAYVKHLPSWSYSYDRGVVVTEDNIVETTEAGYYTDDHIWESVQEEASTASYFDALVQKAIANCIKRGQKFYRSGRILNVWDTKKRCYYFVKAQVQASYEQVTYMVTSTINADTGDILDTTCTCKAQELKRCAHIAGVLHLMCIHTASHGSEGEFLQEMGVLGSDHSNTAMEN